MTISLIINIAFMILFIMSFIFALIVYLKCLEYKKKYDDYRDTHNNLIDNLIVTAKAAGVKYYEKDGVIYAQFGDD